MVKCVMVKWWGRVEGVKGWAGEGGNRGGWERTRVGL